MLYGDETACRWETRQAYCSDTKQLDWLKASINKLQISNMIVGKVEGGDNFGGMSLHKRVVLKLIMKVWEGGMNSVDSGIGGVILWKQNKLAVSTRSGNSWMLCRFLVLKKELDTLKLSLKSKVSPVHSRKTYRGIGGIAPLIFHLGTGWSWAVRLFVKNDPIFLVITPLNEKGLVTLLVTLREGLGLDLRLVPLSTCHVILCAYVRGLG